MNSIEKSEFSVTKHAKERIELRSKLPVWKVASMLSQGACCEVYREKKERQVVLWSEMDSQAYVAVVKGRSIVTFFNTHEFHVRDEKKFMILPEYIISARKAFEVWEKSRTQS